FLSSLPYACEVIIVNDGSKDRTLELLVAWAQEDSRIRLVHLSRNFGHQIAATAGLDHASGDAIVLIDADLQDPLDVIAAMVELYRQGLTWSTGNASREPEKAALNWRQPGSFIG